MFENCGGKIKIFAKVVFFVGSVVSIVAAIIMFTEANDADYSLEERIYIYRGLAYLFIGPLVSWVSSLLMYGFGELVETNFQTARNTRNSDSQSSDISERKSNTVSSVTIASKESVHTGKCDMCDKRDVPVRTVKIVDDLGVRYRNACDECAKKYNDISAKNK